MGKNGLRLMILFRIIFPPERREKSFFVKRIPSASRQMIGHCKESQILLGFPVPNETFFSAKKLKQEHGAAAAENNHCPLRLCAMWIQLQGKSKEK
jgi:hypothetical protein